MIKPIYLAGKKVVLYEDLEEAVKELRKRKTNHPDCGCCWAWDQLIKEIFGEELTGGKA